MQSEKREGAVRLGAWHLANMKQMPTFIKNWGSVSSSQELLILPIA